MDQRLAEEDLEVTKKNFQLLKPFCCEIMVNPSKAAFDKLSRQIEEIPCLVFDPALSNYVFLPFLVHLKILDKYREELKISLFKCLGNILAKSELPSYEMYFDMYTAFNRSLSDPRDPTKFNFNLSEEVTLNILICLHRLQSKKNLEQGKTLQFDSKFISSLGHSIFILLQAISEHHHTEIRLKSMAILEIYAEICSKSQDFSIKFFGFLPGIICKLRGCTTTKKSTYRRAIVLNSLKVLERCISTGLAHQVEEKGLFELDNNFSFVLREMGQELINFDDVGIRKALLEFYIDLFPQFKGKLPQCSKIICDNLLIFNQDPEPEISTKSRELLVEFGIVPALSDFGELLTLLKKSISDLKGNNEDCGALSLKRIVSSLPFIKLSFLDLRAFIPPLTTLSNLLLARPNVQITQILNQNDSIVCIGRKLFQNLIHCSTIDDLLEEFSPILSSSTSPCQSGIILIFNELLESIFTSRTSELGINELTLLVSYYQTLLNSIWNVNCKNIVPIYVKSDPKLTPNEKRGAERRGALILQGLGTLTRFNPPILLPLTLFPLIEFSGISKTSPILSETAIQSISMLSSHLGFKSIGEFLNYNLDLIMSQLSVQFLNISLYSGSADALSFLAPYFDFSQGQFVLLIERILSQSLDSFYGEEFHLIYMRIIHSFMNSLAHHHSIASNNLKPDEKTDEPNGDLFDRILAYQKSIGLDLDLNMEEFDPEKEEKVIENEDSEEKKVLSPELALALRISHASLNFLPSQDRGIQLLAMDTLIQGVELLAIDENSLLPLAHTIWQNLVPRFGESDYVVVRKSFELLLTLTRTSKSFLKKRTLEEIFPALASILTRLAAESQRIKTKNMLFYTHTQGFKLQLTLLEGLADLCSAIQVQEEDLDRVAEGCLIYLDPQQHKQLREAAIKLLQTLSRNSGSRAIWMKLIQNGIVPHPGHLPHPSFTPIPLDFCKKNNLIQFIGFGSIK